MHKGAPLVSPTSKSSGLHHTVMFAHGGDSINPNHGQYSKRRNFEEGGDVEAQPDHRPPPNLVPTPSVLQRAQWEYPALRDQDYGYVEKYTPDKSAGYLEHWEPGDPGNTSGTSQGPYDVARPLQLPLDRPGLEIRNPDTRPIDVVGDIVSHNLVNNDPAIKNVYENFQKSLTPQQHDLLQEQYKYAQANEQEQRPFEQWKQASGMPGLFRGYAFEQWPKEFNDRVYTPEQKQMLDEMMQHLRKKR